MPRLGRRHPVHLEVHLVAVVADAGEVLHPERLHAVDDPIVLIVERQEDCVKVQPPVEHQSRDNARLLGAVAVVVGVVVALVLVSLWPLFSQLVARKGTLSVLEPLVRELGHVAHDHGRRIALLPVEEVEALAPRGKPVVGGDHHEHAKGGLLGHELRGGRDEDLQVVRRSVHERLPLRPLAVVGDDVEGGRRHHDKVRRALADVRRLARAPPVLVARDAHARRPVCIVLARIRTEHAHGALAAATRRRGEARLADQRTPALIVHRGCCFFKPRSGALDLVLVHPLATSGTPDFKGLQCAELGWGNLHFPKRGQN